MPSTYAANSGIELIRDGEQSGTWGTTTNTNLQIIDRLTNGVVTLTMSGTTHTLTTNDGALSNGQYKVLVLGGSPVSPVTLTVDPNDGQHVYYVKNLCGQTVTFTQGSGGNVAVANGDTKIVYCNGAGASAAVVDLTADFAMSSVSITGGTITGITDLALADGGTGASSAADARTNLGVAVGTDVLAYDANLQAFVTAFTLPTTDGTAGQVVFTDGAGTLGFTSAATSSRSMSFSILMS